MLILLIRVIRTYGAPGFTGITMSIRQAGAGAGVVHAIEFMETVLVIMCEI
jgi:hypothetical protein